jgi:hypothetical protein
MRVTKKRKVPLEAEAACLGDYTASSLFNDRSSLALSPTGGEGRRVIGAFTTVNGQRRFGKNVPLEINYACTPMPAQGQTVGKALINLGAVQTSSGQTLVQSSRATFYKDCLFDNFTPDRLQRSGMLARQSVKSCTRSKGFFTTHLLTKFTAEVRVLALSTDPLLLQIKEVDSSPLAFLSLFAHLFLPSRLHC